MKKSLAYKVTYTLLGKKVNTGYSTGKENAVRLVTFVKSLGAENIEVFMSPNGSRRIQTKITSYPLWQNIING